MSVSGNSGLWSKLLTLPLLSGGFPWLEFSSFSPAGRVPGGRGAGLCVGVVPSRPRPGKEAVAGQKSSALLSVWVLLSLLPVFAWEAAGTGVHDKEGSGGGSEGPGGWSWCSFPRSSPMLPFQIFSSFFSSAIWLLVSEVWRECVPVAAAMEGTDRAGRRLALSTFPGSFRERC